MSNALNTALVEAAKAATRLMRAHAVAQEHRNKKNGAS